MMSLLPYVGLTAGLLSTAYGIQLDLNQPSSVDTALSDIAFDMMQYYNGNETGNVPGLLSASCPGTGCYYWWEAGGMWGALINYYQYTGDATYQSNVLQALAFQIGPEKNYNPPNQSKSIGIDDQDFWGFAAMEAAEAGLPNSNTSGVPSWISLAEAVFNYQAPLWDSSTCGGGFRWQIYPFNAGYSYKNSASNGAFFLLAARLARYTGNSTYADWANKVYDWMDASVLLQVQDSTLYVWDGTDANENCTEVSHLVWTYNYGSLLAGSAMMYNYTSTNSNSNNNSSSSTDTDKMKWRTRTTTLLNSAVSLFFPSEYGGKTMSEVTCEPTGNCNTDQSSFKAYLSRWMAVTSVLAPFTSAQIAPVLAASALGAAGQCVGGDNGRMCGREWYNSTWDGSMGVGQQMSALAVIGATRMNGSIAPLRAVDVVSEGGRNSSSTGGGNGSTNSNATMPTFVKNVASSSALEVTTVVFAAAMAIALQIAL